MQQRVKGLLALTALIGLLGGCVPDPTSGVSLSAMPGLAPPPEGFADAYVARTDGAYTLPAIPLEKLPQPMQRQVVDYPTEEVPGTIIIDPAARHLHFVTGRNQAIRYGISVGKAGFEWSGEAVVTNRRPWPTWTPPPEMIERDPKLAKWENGQPGGPTNPLGARAIYLTTNGIDYGYRIHGTPDWQSIGRNASSGCIRMINQDVVDLYERVPDGARVIVLNRDGSRPTGLNLPPPQPRKKTPQPEVVVAAAVMPVADIGAGSAVGPQ